MKVFTVLFSRLNVHMISFFLKKFFYCFIFNTECPYSNLTRLFSLRFASVITRILEPIDVQMLNFTSNPPAPLPRLCLPRASVGRARHRLTIGHRSPRSPTRPSQLSGATHRRDRAEEGAPLQQRASSYDDGKDAAAADVPPTRGARRGLQDPQAERIHPTRGRCGESSV